MANRYLVGCAVLALAIASGTALAQNEDQQPTAPPGPKAGDTIAFCGRVVALVEGGCIGIVGATQTVDLTGVTPKPAIGAVINGTGIVRSDTTICMQGVPLASANWAPTTNCSSGP